MRQTQDKFAAARANALALSLGMVDRDISEMLDTPSWRMALGYCKAGATDAVVVQFIKQAQQEAEA